MESSYQALPDPPFETLPHSPPLPPPEPTSLTPPHSPLPPLSSAAVTSRCYSLLHLVPSLVYLALLVVIMGMPSIIQCDYGNGNDSDSIWYSSLRVGLWQWCSSPAFSSLPPSPEGSPSRQFSYSCQSYSSSDVEMLFPSHAAMFEACRAFLLLSSLVVLSAIVVHVVQLLRLCEPQPGALLSLTALSSLFSIISFLFLPPLTPPLQQAELDLLDVYCPAERRCYRSTDITGWSSKAIVVALALGVAVMLSHCHSYSCRMCRRARLQARRDRGVGFIHSDEYTSDDE